MKLPVKASKCLICCENEPNSWEHTILDCIGSRIEAQLLCTNCNNKYGLTLVRQIKDDPSIQYAVQSLKGEIPDIAEKLQEKQPFLGKDGRYIKIRLDYLISCIGSKCYFEVSIPDKKTVAVKITNMLCEEVIGTKEA